MTGLLSNEVALEQKSFSVLKNRFLDCDVSDVSFYFSSLSRYLIFVIKTLTA